MKRTLLACALVCAGISGIGAGATQVHAASTDATIGKNVKACSNGGWQHLADVAGQPFKSQAACVFYALSGEQFGELMTGHFSFTNFIGESGMQGLLLSGSGTFLGTCTKPLTSLPDPNPITFLNQLPCAVKAGKSGPTHPLSSSAAGSGTLEVLGLGNELATWAYGPHITVALGKTTYHTGELGEGFGTSGGACHSANTRVVLLLVAVTLSPVGPPVASSRITLQETIPAVIGIVQGPAVKNPLSAGLLFFSPEAPSTILTPSQLSSFSMSC